MCTAFYNLAIFENEDNIAIKYCSKSMGYENTRSSFLLQDAVDVLKQCLLRVRVQGGSGFVEEEYGWVLQYQSGNGKSLLLTTRNHHASFPNHCVVTCWQAFYQIVDLCSLCCSPHFF